MQEEMKKVRWYGYMKIHMTIMLQLILCLIGVDITD